MSCDYETWDNDMLVVEYEAIYDLILTEGVPPALLNGLLELDRLISLKEV